MSEKRKTKGMDFEGEVLLHTDVTKPMALTYKIEVGDAKDREDAIKAIGKDTIKNLNQKGKWLDYRNGSIKKKRIVRFEKVIVQKQDPKPEKKEEYTKKGWFGRYIKTMLRALGIRSKEDLRDD